MAQAETWLRGGRAASRMQLRRASPAEYLQYSGMEVLMKDILAQLLEQRPAQAQEVLLASLERAVHGEHCIGRDFSFISASPRNILAFIWAVDDAFSSFHQSEGTLLSIADFHQMLLLLCPDLPLELVEKPAKALREAQLFETAYDYPTLCKAFFIYLYFRKAMPALQARFAVLASGEKLSVDGVIEAACKGFAKTAAHLTLGQKEVGERLVAPLVDHWRKPLTAAFGTTGCSNREEVLSCIIRSEEISDVLRTRPAPSLLKIPDSALLELFQAPQHQGDGAEFEEDDTTDNSDAGGPISLMTWEARMARRYRPHGGKSRKPSVKKSLVPMKKPARQKSQAKGSVK
eukprot:scaffold1390_cov249-Pinguiococcus_pyrenoidosus.AAC.19